MKENVNKSVVIYARESNHAGADESLKRQKEMLKVFCERKGYAVVSEVSTIGSREDSLNALKEAIECAKNTDGKTLLMVSTNRVIGTVKEITAVTELIESAGVKITTIDGSSEFVKKYGVSGSELIYDTLIGGMREASNPSEPIVSKELWDEAQKKMKNK